MQETILQIANWVQVHWPAILSLLGGGAGVSVLLEIGLHKFHINSKKAAYTLAHVLSLAGAASAFYLDHANVVPTYAGLVIAAQTVHRFLVSPAYSKYVVPYLDYLSQGANAADPVTAPNQVLVTPQAEPVAADSSGFVS